LQLVFFAIVFFVKAFFLGVEKGVGRSSLMFGKMFTLEIHPLNTHTHTITDKIICQ
jgi:hypothetical protein